MRSSLAVCSLILLLAPMLVSNLPAEDRPQWGDAWTRNMASGETGLIDHFELGPPDPQTGQFNATGGKNIRWSVKLGNTTYGSPVVADGKVYIGTNNDAPRDERIQGDRGVLMCLDQKTGELLWQLVLPKMTRIKWSDWKGVGITSSPTVEGDRVYLVSNRAEVMCLDVNGMADGNDGPFTDEGQLMAEQGEDPIEPTDRCADVLWLFDMPREVKAEPHNAANGSVLVDGRFLYVPTANGVEWTHEFVVHPEAPSLIVLDKETGKLVARDAFDIGPDITHGQWSSVTAGEVAGRPMGFYGAGDGVLYAFDLLAQDHPSDRPTTIEPVWTFNGHPAAQTQETVEPDHQHNSTSYEVTAMPVLRGDRLYVNFTQEPYHRMRDGWLVCLDATGKGDITRTGLIWSYDALGSSTSTPAIVEDRLYVAGFNGRLHCLDVDTGKSAWVYDVGAPCPGSPLVADGKIYLGTDRQTFWILRAGDKPEVLCEQRLPGRISSSAVAVDGTVYMASWRFLFALEKN